VAAAAGRARPSDSEAPMVEKQPAPGRAGRLAALRPREPVGLSQPSSAPARSPVLEAEVAQSVARARVAVRAGPRRSPWDCSSSAAAMAADPKAGWVGRQARTAAPVLPAAPRPGSAAAVASPRCWRSIRRRTPLAAAAPAPCRKKSYRAPADDSSRPGSRLRRHRHARRCRWCLRRARGACGSAAA